MENENKTSYKIDHNGFLIEGFLQRLGDEILLSIWGGKAHIGAVAIAQPRPSLSDPEKTSSSVSVFCYTGHKEDDLAKNAAEELASTFNVKVVVVAGIHWDNITKSGIATIGENVKRLIKQIKKEAFHGNE